MSPDYRWHNRERMREVRRQALAIVGERCVRCGYDTDERALCFDHIHDDGVVHRASGMSRNAAQWVVYKATVDEARAKLQTLCANCNLIKQIGRTRDNGTLCLVG